MIQIYDQFFSLFFVIHTFMNFLNGVIVIYIYIDQLHTKRSHL
jgi:hypothetical protein